MCDLHEAAEQLRKEARRKARRETAFIVASLIGAALIFAARITGYLR